MPTAPRTRIRIVQSRANARVKELRAALARPGSGLIGLEGEHLVEEALRSGIDVRTIFVRTGEEAVLEAMLEAMPAELRNSVREGSAEGRPHLEPELLSVPADLLRSVVTTEAPQAIAALAVPPAFTLEAAFRGPDAGSRTDSTTRFEASTAGTASPLLLVLAGLQDPGNVGTILRSAEAFGASGVLALSGTANRWNAKSLRASMGSAFRLPVVPVSAEKAFSVLAAHGVRSLAAVAPAHPHAQSLGSADLAGPVALWIGNEGSGLPADLIAGCDAAVTIPCPGPVDSLNAAIAGSVLLYEASRQRAASPERKQHPRSA
jgi:TrmH family RNA methyltransferase